MILKMAHSSIRWGREGIDACERTGQPDQGRRSSPDIRWPKVALLHPGRKETTPSLFAGPLDQRILAQTDATEVELELVLPYFAFH